ncbi:MAG: hypothetical protein CL678_01760 [Bdellovibrionaceae bacterium]|nr:hypothetical protein [Pseudobdellovibrionaceae bacterium]|tara:strand:- start:1246 stop:2421 length:1176 start_codon:yes stop_codon:yes gene_type:complete
MNPLYQGSVKRVYGPARVNEQPAFVFEFSDRYSIFDWGQMPDSISGKGRALSEIGALLFEELGEASAWQAYFKSPQALSLRKGASLFSGEFSRKVNEWGECLQSSGCRHHFLGRVKEVPQTENESLLVVDEETGCIAVQPIQVMSPEIVSVADRQFVNYAHSLKSTSTRLIPLEVIFRYGLTDGSSFLESAQTSGYTDSIVFSSQSNLSGPWDFPVIEMTTKLETIDRKLLLGEAMQISGLTGEQMNALVIQTAWISSWLKWRFAQKGIELIDGKLEWAIQENGELMLVDSIGPDELRLVKNGKGLSKQFLRNYYLQSSWYQELSALKKKYPHDRMRWKKETQSQPSSLPKDWKDVAERMYQFLKTELKGESGESFSTLNLSFEALRSEKK